MRFPADMYYICITVGHAGRQGGTAGAHLDDTVDGVFLLRAAAVRDVVEPGGGS
jgi:hypothetical protein